MASLSSYLSKEGTQIPKGTWERCLTSWIIMELKVKIIMKYHLAPVKIAITRKTRSNIFGKDMKKKKKKKSLSTAGLAIIKITKVQKQNYHLTQQFYFWVFIWRKCKHSKRYIHSYVHCSTIYGSQDKERR